MLKGVQIPFLLDDLAAQNQAGLLAPSQAAELVLEEPHVVLKSDYLGFSFHWPKRGLPSLLIS